MKVPYFVPWITSDDKKSVIRVMNQRWLTNGPTLKKFEEKISSFVGSKYSVGVGSATHALHLCVKSLGIGPGDEVIVPTFTFAATANAVSYCGAEPILTDVDADSFNIAPKEIERNITRKTKAIIVVHYGGQACDMDAILSLSKKHGLDVIEDCAHSLGSTYGNMKCGNMGIGGCFSFYPTKVITTGEGGMVTTNNFEIYKKMQSLKSHAMSTLPTDRETKAQWRYDVMDLGYNYRLDEIRAALGLSQFSRINKINEMRKKIAKKYDEEIKKIRGISVPQIYSNRNHIYHLYTIKIEDDYHLNRDELFLKLHKHGIGASVQYYPLHLMSYNKKKYRQRHKNFPVSNILKDKVLCLPIYPKMTSKQIQHVIACLR